MQQRSLTGEVAALRERMSNSKDKQELAELRAKEQALRSEHAALEERTNKLQATFDAMRIEQGERITWLKGEIDAFKNKQAQLESELAVTKAQRSAVQAKLDETQAQMAALSQAAPRPPCALVFTDVQVRLGSRARTRAHTHCRRHRFILCFAILSDLAICRSRQGSTTQWEMHAEVMSTALDRKSVV